MHYDFRVSFKYHKFHFFHSLDECGLRGQRLRILSEGCPLVVVVIIHCLHWSLIMPRRRRPVPPPALDRAIPLRNAQPPVVTAQATVFEPSAASNHVT